MKLNMRFSTLIWLILFVLAIFIVSIIVAWLFWGTLIYLGFLAPPESRFALFTFLFLTVSVLVGTALTAIGGIYFLRPLHRLTMATKEIARGNFNVQVEAKGSKELTRLSASFNEMAQELSLIETLKSDFVSNISHEFKTPVTSIKGFAKRLLKNNLTETERKEYLQIIVDESERLSRLSSNVLLLSNLENYSHEAEQAEYFLDEQLRRLILLCEPQLQKKDLEVEIRLAPIKIKANEEILHHVWLNLLGNAIKFSDLSGKVCITLKSEKNNAIVSISDNGVGINADEKKRIFEKFYQADQSRATEGNGLGLALVKKILDIENGKIEVESEVGEGTQFTVQLPISNPHPANK